MRPFADVFECSVVDGELRKEHLGTVNRRQYGRLEWHKRQVVLNTEGVKRLGELMKKREGKE